MWLNIVGKLRYILSVILVSVIEIVASKSNASTSTGDAGGLTDVFCNLG